MNRDFKGIWIPKELYLLDKSVLSWSEKILLIEIHSFTNEANGCFASNKYLGDFIGVSAGRIANMKTKLRKLGLIVDNGFDGRRKTVSTTKDFTKKLRQLSRKSEGSLNIKVKKTSHKSEHNNTGNNTGNNIGEYEEKPSLLENDNPKDSKEKKPKEKSSAKKEKVVEYPKTFSESMIVACEAWFEYRKQIGFPFSNVFSKQTRVMAWQAEVAEYKENIVIASIYEAISQNWRKTYPKPNTDKKYFKGSKQPKQAKKREVDGVLMSKLDGLKSRGIITYDRMNEILSWDSDEEISKEVDKLMKKPQQL